MFLEMCFFFCLATEASLFVCSDFIDIKLLALWLTLLTNFGVAAGTLLSADIRQLTFHRILFLQVKFLLMCHFSIKLCNTIFSFHHLFIIFLSFNTPSGYWFLYVSTLSGLFFNASCCRWVLDEHNVTHLY